MTDFDKVIALRDLDIPQAADFLGVDVSTRRPITGYGKLADVEVIDSKDRATRFLLRGDDVVLVYIGSAGLPEGLTSDAVATAVGDTGQRLRSRQGKRAHMHVAAEKGVAWSELDGTVGFVELFPPMALEDYRERIYKEPGPFKR